MESTLIIRGNDEKELVVVKKILNFMVFATYSLNLENYVLRDEFASVDPIEVSSFFSSFFFFLFNNNNNNQRMKS